MCKATDILTTATKADNQRRVKACESFTEYRLLTQGSVLNTRTGDIYHATGYSNTKGYTGCDCPDFSTRIMKLRDAMTAADVATTCNCKHVYIRRLLSGESVKVGGMTVRAKRK